MRTMRTIQTPVYPGQTSITASSLEADRPSQPQPEKPDWEQSSAQEHMGAREGRTDS